MYKYSLDRIRREVYEYVEHFHLYEDGFFTEDFVDYFIANIGEDKEFNYDTGATKCIIIPEGKDYVIKIPFNGVKSCCEDCEYCGDPYDCDLPKCPITSFYGGGGRYSDNYCELEREIYNKIIEDYPEFKDFFLPLEWITDIDDYPIYIQAKAEVHGKVYWKRKSSISAESQSIVKSNEVEECNAPNVWLAQCLEDLGNNIEKYNKFVEMLKKLKITGDLHNDNVGYYNNHAVILDYAGYHD